MFGRRARHRAVPQLDVQRFRADAGTVAVQLRNAVLHNKWAGGLAGLWVLGLLITFVLPAPVHVTDEMHLAYVRKAVAIDHFDEPLSKAARHMFESEAVWRHERVRLEPMSCQLLHQGDSAVLTLICVRCHGITNWLALACRVQSIC